MENEELVPDVRSALTMARAAVVKQLKEGGGDPRTSAPDRLDLNYAALQIVRWRSLERSMLRDSCRDLFPELDDQLAEMFLDELIPRLEAIFRDY
jgi:hypothetical protein